MNLVGDLDRIAVGLPINVEQHSGFPVGGYDRIHGFNVRCDRGHVTDTHRNARRRGLNDGVCDLFGIAHLPIHEPEK